MFLLRQILPALLMPTVLSLVLVIAGLLGKRRWSIWIGVGLLWLASTPLVGDQMVRGVEEWAVRTPASQAGEADAIVVLAATQGWAPGPEPTPQWQDADRFFGGIELLQSGKAPLLVFTNGWSPLQPEDTATGRVSMRRARALGIPADRMASTPVVTTTAEEAVAVAALLRQRGIATADQARPPRVLLVTSAFHMPRARTLFERAGLMIMPFPVDFRASETGRLTMQHFVPNGGSLRQTELALREIYGRLFYLIVAD